MAVQGSTQVMLLVLEMELSHRMLDLRFQHVQLLAVVIKGVPQTVAVSLLGKLDTSNGDRFLVVDNALGELEVAGEVDMHDVAVAAVCVVVLYNHSDHVSHIMLYNGKPCGGAATAS